MPSLDGIKSRIKSVEATSKITSAMELVATAKLKRAKDEHERVGAYSNVVYEKVNEILSSINSESKYTKEADGNTLFIIVTSDLGLCGGYNANSIRQLKDQVKGSDKVIVIGNKGGAAMKHSNITPLQVYGDLKGTISYNTVNEVSKQIISAYNDKEMNITSVKLIYTKFINNVTFESTTIPILPAKLAEGIEVKKVDFEFEPSPEVVLDQIIPLYIGAVIYGKVVESQLSEQASRRTAMETATDNANELKSDLKLKYNRARQANITQEISEIVAGANAI